MTGGDWLQISLALVGWVVIGGVLADLVYFDALSRGRTPEGWAVGTFFSALVGAAYVLLVARRTPRQTETKTLRAMGRRAARDHMLGPIVPPTRTQRVLRVLPPMVMLVAVAVRHVTN
jgi:hypothetical protein